MQGQGGKKGLNQICVDGELLHEPREIKMVVSFKCANLAKLGGEMKVLLERRFTEDEI